MNKNYQKLIDYFTSSSATSPSRAISLDHLTIGDVSREELNKMISLMSEFHTNDGVMFWYKDKPLINSKNALSILRTIVGIIIAGFVIALFRIIF